MKFFLFFFITLGVLTNARRYGGSGLIKKARLDLEKSNKLYADRKTACYNPIKENYDYETLGFLSKEEMSNWFLNCKKTISREETLSWVGWTFTGLCGVVVWLRAVTSNHF